MTSWRPSVVNRNEIGGEFWHPFCFLLVMPRVINRGLRYLIAAAGLLGRLGSGKFTANLPRGVPIMGTREKIDMKRLFRMGFLSGLVFIFTAPAFAETTAQFVFAGIRSPNDDNVTSFRFSLLYASANDVSGFDLGFVSFAQSNNFNGFGPLFAIANVEGNSEGCLCSFANIVGGESKGINAGFLNITQKLSEGVNLGFLNFTSGFSNIDVSALGVSQESNVQVGLINVTGEIQTIQIGFLNFAKNGFFPVFPFFNIPKSSAD